MSGAGSVVTSHDVTERLSWKIQAPLTIRPQDFEAFLARSAWQTERNKMKEICLQCHGHDREATWSSAAEALEGRN
jgi:hypothetical protein